jgi:shikimate kinase
MKINRIDLIGYRGAGKSTIGAILAERLGWTFIDSDQEIEKESGNTIVEMFRKDVNQFRRMETELMRRLSKRTNVVIAWGGGIVLSAANREMLQDQFCVWLTADPTELYRRIKDDPSRPPLTEIGGLAEVEQVLQERQPLYASAKLTVATENRSPEDIVAEIMLVVTQQGVDCQ